MIPALDNFSNNEVSCLVVGNSGFLGCELAKKLLSQNCEVIFIDNLKKYNANWQHLKKLAENKNFTIIDTKDNFNFEKNLNKRPDYIFHLKLIDLYESFDSSISLSRAYEQVEIKKYVEWCQNNGSKFLLASIESLYEEGFLQLQQLGGDSIDRSIFWQVQDDVENFLIRANHQSNLNSRIVRIGDFGGIGLFPGSCGALKRLVLSAIQNESIILPNDGLDEIYPTHIEDIAFGMIKAMFSQSSRGKMYALINKKGTSLSSVAYLLQKKLGNISINYSPVEIEGQRQGITQAMINSQEVLGWFAHQSWEAVVLDSLDWLQKLYPKKINNKPQLISFQDRQENKQSISNPISNTTISQKVVSSSGLGSHSNLINLHAIKKRSISTPPLTIQPPVVRLSLLSGGLARFLISSKKSKNTLGIFIALILFLIIIPQVVFEFSYKSQLSNYQHNVDYVLFQKEDRHNVKLEALTQRMVQSLKNIVLWQRRLVGTNENEKYEIQIQKMIDISDIVKDLNLIDQNIEKIIDVVLGRGAEDLTKLQQNSKRELAAVYDKLAFIEAYLKKDNQFSSDLNTILQIKNHIINWQESISQISELFAFDGRRVVAIMVGDSLELRPSGGFLDSVVLLTFEKGKLLDIQTRNIYDLDANLKGIIKPPPELSTIIEQHLGEDQWWLRDANMFADFPSKTAPRIAWFLQKQTNITIDNVWMVDSYFVQSLIGLLGPIYLPEYNETINGDNFFERLYSHATLNLGNEKNSISYLQSISNHLSEKVKVTNSSNLVKILPFLAKQASQRHFMVWYGNYGQQLTMQPWGGEIRKTPNQVVEFGALSIADYIMPIDINLGINKANYYIERALNYSIILDKESQSIAKITYTLANSSQTQNWPSGSYKTMVWLYVPQEAILDKVWVKNDNGDDVEVDAKNVEIVNDAGKRRVGLYIEVPPVSKRVIGLAYKLPQFLDENNTFGLYIQKQPGIRNLPVQIIVNYPQTLSLSKLSQQVRKKNGYFELEQDLEKDMFFAVSFSH